MLSLHLSQVHQNSIQRKAINESTKKNEREYIEKRQRDDDLRETEKQFY